MGKRGPFPEIAARCHVAGYDIVGSACSTGRPTCPDCRFIPAQGTLLVRADRRKVFPVNPPFDHPRSGFATKGRCNPGSTTSIPNCYTWRPTCRGHIEKGPATAVLEMALAAAWVRRPDARAVEVVDVELRRPPFE
jgi:hypothetical protein